MRIYLDFESMLNLISPLFFQTGTKFANHLENLKETIILASNIFLTSFSISGRSNGLILLSLCLKGFSFSLMGIVC